MAENFQGNVIVYVPVLKCTAPVGTHDFRIEVSLTSNLLIELKII